MKTASVGTLAASTIGAGAVSDSASVQALDVIVIGGGFAGVAAARELAQAGLRSLLLEARNRLGGRTFSSQFAGHEVELGGNAIHWIEPHVWAEVNRYRLGIKEAPGAALPDTMTYRSGGKTHTVAPMDTLIELDRACALFCAPSREVFPRPYEPFFSAALQQYDHMTIEARLQQLELAPHVRDLVNGNWSTAVHNFISQGSFVECMRLYALAGHDMARLNEAASRYIFKDGTVSLLNAMLADCNAQVLLSTPVSKLTRANGQVVVTTESGEQYSARAAIVAVPMNTLHNIEFSPPLSSGKLAASTAGHAGAGTKILVHVRQQLGNVFVLAPDHEPINFMFTEHSGEDGTILVAMSASPEHIDVNDNAEVQSAVRLFLPHVDVVDSFAYEWTRDPFSLGTYCTLRPMQLTQSLRELQRPEGEIFFAGADIANGWRGFIDGAIESGMRVGHEVAESLR